MKLCSAKVKNMWSYTSTPPDGIMAWYLVKHRDNLTLFSLLFQLTLQLILSKTRAKNDPLSL
jgi:hypothetical protein